MNKISVIGLDLAKNVFQIHSVDSDSEVELSKQLKRAVVLRYFAQLPPRLIGMEVCGGVHYWARELTQRGHTVRIMAPASVKPYLKSNKNDRTDAEVICEAVQRPNMRFVRVKTPEQTIGAASTSCASMVGARAGGVVQSSARSTGRVRYQPVSGSQSRLTGIA
ncbi:MAG: transposase [Candidatus Thiodiazotropha sp.]